MTDEKPVGYFPNPFGSPRARGLTEIAKIHWRDHEEGHIYNPSALSAAEFVENIKFCSKCAPAFRALPPK